MSWDKFAAVWDFKSLPSESEREILYSQYDVYPESFNISAECSCFMARDTAGKFLIVAKGDSMSEFRGETINIYGRIIKKCPLSVENSRIIRRIFEYANPVTVGSGNASLGLGDRLGLASPGHIRIIKGKGVFPVLAQQSIRELTLTGRSYNEVLASAVWAVVQEGYRDGYGADGDHLKTDDEVEMALDCGFTMITLDCSEYIDNSIEGMGTADIKNSYECLPASEREYWEGKYLGKVFKITGGIKINVTRPELMKTVLIYRAAVNFAWEVFSEHIKYFERKLDFEISIDETLTPTDIKAHYILAAELRDRGVVIANMAPRFCGEFQKGIDYRGDRELFKEEFVVHSAIARHFGYRISVHSGSDKFSIFPIVGKETSGRFHIKTAGTNWLEALRVIAVENPVLFRKMYTHALLRLNDAKEYYHIYTESEMVPDISGYADGRLGELLDIEESRQALHITYGYILNDKDDAGEYILRDEFFNTLHEHEDTYCEYLERHIGRHLESLGIG
jgi:hypothetical protein